MLDICQHLILALNRKKVSYCHWKSNLLLAEALGGYDDLDLLVLKKDVSAFQSCIFEIGFIEADNQNTATPSVKHYYGFDPTSEKILHLHVYFRLLTGASWIKDLILGVEKTMLSKIVMDPSGVPIPPKYMERVIFVIRCMFKYALPNEVILIEKEKGRVLRELEFLTDEGSLDEEATFIENAFPALDYELYLQCIEAIKAQNKPRLFWLGNRLKRQLRSNIRYTSIQAIRKNLSQVFYRVFNKIFFKKKKQLASGGMFIAVVGLDASGKSTVTTEIETLLKANFTTSLIHFGKPPSAWFTSPFNLLIKLLRKEQKSKHSFRSSLKNEEKVPGLLFALRQLILAYDRFVLIEKNWKKVLKGEIVICDRYKTQQFCIMDSPRINPNQAKGLVKTIAEWENKLYEKMPAPDLLFQLLVPVEVAVIRNKKRIKQGKESEEFLRQRHLENANLTYNCNSFVPIDTDKDQASVHAEIKTILWENL